MKQIIEFNPKEVARILLRQAVNEHKIPGGEYICHVQVFKDPENSERIDTIQLTVSDPE